MPPRVASPLYRQLIQEWVHVNTLTSSTVAAARWGRLEPVLAGHARPADLVDAVDSATCEEQDSMLLALMRLTQAGHQLAGRVVLQLMLPKLGRMTNRTSGTTSDNAWSEDRRHIAVAEFWDVVATYPVSRRTRKVAANLALETLRRLTAATRGPRPDLPVDEQDLHRALPSTAADQHSHTNELTTEADLVQVISWAVNTGVLTADDGRLLHLVYLSGTNGGRDDAATQYGLTAAAVRQRCSRARRRLVVAVRDELTNDGDPTLSLAHAS
ncbi:hypothetical protein GCM10009616_34360 [Microlunatus lacustris]